MIIITKRNYCIAFNKLIITIEINMPVAFFPTQINK